MSELRGSRVLLRPLRPADFEQWREVRRRSAAWLTRWEPMRVAGSPDVVEDRDAFASRCRARERERQLGIGYGFGIFVPAAGPGGPGGPAAPAERAERGPQWRLAGEVNLSNVQRGPMQSAYVGYWIDEALAGHGYVPEAVVVVFGFAFDDLGLHRLQVSIVPRNAPSRRVAEKLGLREEGIAERYLEINGVWEDHVRYAITAEEWRERRADYTRRWLSQQSPAPGAAG